jgi:hypothetical protein
MKAGHSTCGSPSLEKKNCRDSTRAIQLDPGRLYCRAAFPKLRRPEWKPSAGTLATHTSNKLSYINPRGMRLWMVWTARLSFHTCKTSLLTSTSFNALFAVKRRLSAYRKLELHSASGSGPIVTEIKSGFFVFQAYCRSTGQRTGTEWIVGGVDRQTA